MGEAGDRLEQLYRDWSPGSLKRMQDARAVMPGGDTRASAHYRPYPLFVERGEGSRLYDVDGHQLVDFMNNFTSLVHGHAHAPTVAAVTEQIERGSAYAAPTESQVELARIICARVASIDEVRFTSSGSEATNMCIRAARAHTGKPKIIKVEGGYHGSHEIGEMSLVPLPGKAGPLESPTTLPPDRSINASEVQDVITIPYNEIEIARQHLERHADEVAALIVEPLLASMGMIAAEEEYLRALRQLTEECEVLMIVDEVVTLRLGVGGFQQVRGIAPDLTSMGKIIGGGLPVGCFGGRRELMELFNPERRDSVMHTSTFSGNALTMAAGIASMNALTASEIARINTLGDELRAGFDRAFASAGVRGRTLGWGSLCNLHLYDGEIRNARDTLRGFAESGRMSRLLHLGLLRRGIFSSPRGMFNVSTAMTRDDVTTASDALADTLTELRPAIEQECPSLAA
jgi:glutamate-1-semialdehyde 2,1-aminomutase